MSRYRNIHCMIWNDDKFPFASDDCQLVFFHLLTTPFGSPFGLFKASIAMLADEKRWSKQRYEKAFREGLAKGFFKYDERHLVVFLPKFVKYNQPQNANVITNWKKLFDELPPSPLNNEWIQTVKGLLKAFHKAFEEAFGKGMPIQEQEQEQEQIKDSSSDVEAIRLADLLFTEILRQQPKSKLHAVNNGKRQETINRWAEDIEKLKRIDQRGIDDIQAVILWATADEFWKSNILSGAKLREKWDTLVAQMERKGIEKDSRSSWLDT